MSIDEPVAHAPEPNARSKVGLTFGVLLLTWWLLAGLHHALDRYVLTPSLVESFPIPQFSGWVFHSSGALYIIALLLMLGLSLKFAARLSPALVIGVGALMIALGNLGQGGFHAAYIAPFEATKVQYLQDALRIVSPWREWLADFNDIQSRLMIHGRTHPPFAVLVHLWLLRAGGGSTAMLALVFAGISSASVAVMWWILWALDVPESHRRLLTLTFALIPAVNIYSTVSLDGVILTTASLFLLGLVIAMRRPGMVPLAALLCVMGFLLTNLLTYGGVFLLGIGVVMGVRELMLRRGPTIALLTGISALTLMLVIPLLNDVYHYDHIRGLLTALQLESPRGFLGLSDPASYIQSRIEDASEIAFFLSFGCVAVLLAMPFGHWLRGFADDGIALAIAAFAMIAGFLVAGVFPVGETARVCLYVYPYLLLPLRRLEEPLLRRTLLLAGVQTAAMQLFGSYSW